ncbi:MAG TPA: hypothetical protein VGI28_02445 [Stellaceae bacterium]|jgi:hypothetical protein
MIKKLLLIGALLAPALGYCAGPSNDLSKQLVLSAVGGSGGNGGSGRSGSGGRVGTRSGGGGDSPSAPAAATAGCSSSNGGGRSNGSCFKTLALNMDFTGATQSGYSNGAKFNADKLSNWLDCAGATSPTMGNSGFSAGAPPCSVYSIINDYGTNTLDMTFTPSMTTSNNAELYTKKAIPQEYYVEAKLRTDSASDSTCPNGVPCQDFWSYTYGGSGAPTMEWDFIEMYNSQQDAGGSNVGPGTQVEQHGANSSLVPGYNHDNYNIFGERITQDGTGKVSICFYVNNVQVPVTYGRNRRNCAVRHDRGWLLNYSAPLSAILQSGDGGHTVSNNINLYVQWLRIWTCPNWTNANSPNYNGFACTGAIISSNP